jgi:hypothetical protein
MRKIKIQLCEIAEKDHQKKKRNYAHTFHKKNVICVCKDLYQLPLRDKAAIIAHEFGHLFAGKDGTEEDANREVFNYFSINIYYRPRTRYGDNLECIDQKDIEVLISQLIPLIHPSSLK